MNSVAAAYFNLLMRRNIRRNIFRRDLSRKLLLIPTTEAALNNLAKQSGLDMKIAMGDVNILSPLREAGWHIMGPAECLEWLSGLPVSAPITIFSFPDQCVEPHLAPILVKNGGTSIFMPAAEILLICRYGFEPLAVSFNIPAGTSPKVSKCDALKVLLAYFQACFNLNDRWLVSDRQKWRDPDERRRLAGFYRRRLQASLLAMLETSDTAAFDWKQWTSLTKSTFKDRRG